MKNNTVNSGIIEKIGSEIKELKKKRAIEPIFVVSGSIGLGMKILGYKERPKEQIILQRCAGVGQIELMNVYTAAFRRFNLITSQYLLTYHNLVFAEESETICKNIKDDVSNGIILLVNYNDRVDWQETVMDNDKLAAKIALVAKAGKLLILTNGVNGLMDNKNLISEVKLSDIEKCKKLCNGAGEYGTGGFETKLEAARIVVSNGIECVIGNINYRIEDLLEGTVPRTVIAK